MTDFTTDRDTRLDDLRGALLAAAAADLENGEAARPVASLPRPVARPPRRLHLGTTRARLALTLLVLAVAAPGVVMATGLIGPERAAANGLPAGSTVMTATQPTCTAVVDGVEYECAFAVSPRVGRVVGTLDASGHLNGGCRSQNAIETVWICYFGEAAVQHHVIAQEVL